MRFVWQGCKHATRKAIIRLLRRRSSFGRSPSTSLRLLQMNRSILCCTTLAHILERSRRSAVVQKFELWARSEPRWRCIHDLVSLGYQVKLAGHLIGTVRAEHTVYARLTPIRATPRTSSTFASISGAFIPANWYIFAGELWSINVSGNTIERNFRPSSNTPSSDKSCAT